jgi:hypothetical protein
MTRSKENNTTKEQRCKARMGLMMTKRRTTHKEATRRNKQLVVVGSLSVTVFLVAVLSNFLVASKILRQQSPAYAPVVASTSLVQFHHHGTKGVPSSSSSSWERKRSHREQQQLLDVEDDEEDVVRSQLNGLLIANTTKTQKRGSSSSQQQVDEQAIPNPTPPFSGYDSFAACLLVMDDNHRLVEWLAYHYHVLPLRYLVVAVDPRSRTSPTPILNRYRRKGVTIEEWTDHDFLGWAHNVMPENARLQIKRDRHRARQKVFYKACLQKMKQANRTFTILQDTDEFLVYNHPSSPPPATNSSRISSKQRRNEGKNRQSAEGDTTRARNNVPTTADPGAMLRYIRQQQAMGNKYFESPCISIPRLHFGAVESTPAEIAKDVPEGLFLDHHGQQQQQQQLDTLRWRKHSKRDDHVKNNLGKVIMDVSRVDIAAAPRFRSLHRPIPTICTAPWVADRDAGLRINHYLGSWESYSFRDDCRRGGERSREVWEFQAQDQQETDDTIRPWLHGFVKANGQDTAKELLYGAGLPKSYRNRNETGWRSMWIEDILKTNQTEGTNPKNHEFDAFVRRKFNPR